MSNSNIERLQRDINNLEKLIKREAKPRVSHTSQSLDNKENMRPSIEAIPLEEKHLLIAWLQEIRLLKSNIKELENRLPNICKDGVIFFDLLNRLGGREEVLHGAIRKPKTVNQVLQNYRRVLSYLKSFLIINSY